MKLIITIITISLIIPLSLYANLPIDTVSFVPENNLRVTIYDKNASNVTEQDFNAILDKVESIYASIVAEKGGRLEVVRNWGDSTVNAYANREGANWKIHMFGGLARHNSMPHDGFVLVACHELGHQIGGAPKGRTLFFKSWASNEGQSDYFAALKCLKRVFEKEDNITDVASMQVDPVAANACEQSLPNLYEQSICKRVAMAGQSVARLFAALGGGSGSFSTPDRNVVSRTNNSHPSTQCRLDTYLAGALCHQDPYLDLSDKDEQIGACNEAEGHTIGFRP